MIRKPQYANLIIKAPTLDTYKAVSFLGVRN